MGARREQSHHSNKILIFPKTQIQPYLAQSYVEGRGALIFVRMLGRRGGKIIIRGKTLTVIIKKIYL